MQLVLPHLKYEQSYREYIAELGVWPAKRGQGLGNLLLKLTLDKAFERGINPVHIHCHKHNAPSANMIIANGGVLESEIDHGGEAVQRYQVKG